MLRYIAVMLRCVAVCCGMGYIAVYCGMLRCVAVCCGFQADPNFFSDGVADVHVFLRILIICYVLNVISKVVTVKVIMRR
jgi:hypothetical protein